MHQIQPSYITSCTQVSNKALLERHWVQILALVSPDKEMDAANPPSTSELIT